MKLDDALLERLEPGKVYCQTCLLEGKIKPLEIDGDYYLAPCGHTGRNKNTLRFHDGEWHVFYGFLLNAQCRTCHARKNHAVMNDPDGEPRRKLKQWYASDECKALLRKNADAFRASEAGKQQAIRNAEKWRSSKRFKEHGADGLRAYLQTDEFKQRIMEHNKKNLERINQRVVQYCEKCGCETPHNGFGTCLVCNPEAAGRVPSFITKHDVVYYKGKPLELLCERILHGEIDLDLYPGFSVRLGRVCYRNIDVLNGQKILLNGKDFVNHKEELWYHDKSLGDYVPWEQYRQSFVERIAQYEGLPDEFHTIPTFRLQESSDWSGASSAFERNLVELDVGWFVYVKFYIDERGRSVPLVVGKSGSLLVNSSGTDLSFSIDVSDGPARRFLRDGCLEWDRTKIAICPCDSKNEAYHLERKISRDFNLFES